MRHHPVRVIHVRCEVPKGKTWASLVGYAALVEDSLRLRLQNTRNEIASGALRGPAFRELLLSIPARDRDAWLDALFGFEDPPPDVADLPRGAVPYLPCGVEEILRAIDEAPVRAHDVLVDLGAGLGRVALLAHLLTGARAHGIEIQQPLVTAANACRDALALSDVTFEHANAEDVVLSGSIFFSTRRSMARF